MTKTVLESDLLQEREDHYELTEPLPPLAIPTTLNDALMARLDRLAAVKTVAQLGATIGRQFSYALLSAVAPLDETQLKHHLRQLVEAELLMQRGVPPHATYIFKHALIQDAAYRSLLKSTRRQYHQRIANILETRFPEMIEGQPELLAYHYTEAGRGEQAVGHWQQAGHRALQGSAYVEALSHLRTGLELLATLPETPTRAQHELTLHLDLGFALSITKGYANPEVERVYRRARELCQQVGESPQLFPALDGLRSFFLVRAEYQTACELGEQLLTLAQHAHNPAHILAAHRVLGITLFWQGELAPSQAHLERVMTRYHPQQHAAVTFSHGAHIKVHCLSYVALILAWCGSMDQALHTSQEALSLTRELTHPFSRATALFFTAWLHCERRDVHACQEYVEAAVALSAEQGFPFWHTAGIAMQGWVLAEQEQHAEGIAQVQQGLAAYRATGAVQWIPRGLALLAEVCGKGGKVTEGLHALDEALTLVDKTGERFYAAEFCRLKGELLLKQTNSDAHQAETCFHQALDIARGQQAKSLELRAATSLSRLWQQQDKRDEARQLLSEIYGWFTEGFDTADLKDAKALLDELA